MGEGARPGAAARDALMVAGFTAVVFAIALYVDLAERTFILLMQYQHFRLDELPPTLSALAVALLWFAYRRWRELRAAVAERERLVAELREALAQVTALRGLLPICAWCKRIRDDAGHWGGLETYIEARSHAQFTHDVCPECEARLVEGLPRS